jgi:hypothetical protein
MSLTVKRLKRGVVLLKGRLTADGSGIGGPFVEIYTGNRRVGRAKLARGGGFSFRKRIKRKTRFQARINVAGSLASCPAPPIGAPQGCQTATLWVVARSRTVLARPKR